MKITHRVRQSLFSIGFALSLSFVSHAISLHSAFAAPLPDIEAHNFESTPIRLSKSRRVYLFKTEPNQLPKTGNLVLIYDHNRPAMALRVLKTDALQSEYIAKRVRRYDQTGELVSNQRYKTIEKISDLLTSPATEGGFAPVPTAPAPSDAPDSAINTIAIAEDPQTDQNDADLDAPINTQTHLDVNAYEDDLDGTTSPNAATEAIDTNGSEDDSAKTAFEIDETPRLSPLKNMMGVNAGFFRNMSNFLFAGGTHNALLLNYSRKLRDDLFVIAKAPQDSLSLEFGLGYYSIVNFIGQNDEFKIIPMIAELRYDLHLSPAFTTYLYGGFEYNLIVAATNAERASDLSRKQQDAFNRLGGPQPTLGLGFLYNMGPQWYLRVNLGLDRLSAGLAIKW